MKKIAFLCDFYLEDFLGGGEICNECVIQNFKNKKYTVEKLRTNQVNINTIANYKDYFFVVGNFLLLKQDTINFIKDNINYVIYEHDYKFLKNRNPAKFLNFEAPSHQILFYDFYKNAKKIICQTDFQKNIVEKNLKLDNVISLGTNFWLEKHYDVFEKMFNQEKKQKCAVIEYNVDHKNTKGAIEYCIKNNLEFDLISDKNYENFLKKLGSYKSFVFLPKTPETFSRTILEARMMNVEIYSNNLIGCTKEEWFKDYKGLELIRYTKEKNKQAFKIFEELV
jgi:hypothetical protein